MEAFEPRHILRKKEFWIITGGAGFIGFHVAEALLRDGQVVRILDDLSTGSSANVTALREIAMAPGSGTLEFLEGSVVDPEVCRLACRGVDRLIHLAALGSVPRSIEDPELTHAINVTGFLNVLIAAREAGLRRLVHASSSAVYGDDTSQPKKEENAGAPLVPYASSKRTAEFYARNFANHYGLETIALRYFNIYGPRQDPNGPYAAVIPRWIAEMSGGEVIQVNGDGEISRDFCFVADVVQANLLAATCENYRPEESVFNIASGRRASLNNLHETIRELLLEAGRPAPPPPLTAPNAPAICATAMRTSRRHEESSVSVPRLIYRTAYV
jgi:UDP-N-acetylglucosamine 4-epimerase